MGFWSGLGSLAMGMLEGIAVGNAHPALQKAWSRYEARGYTIAALDTYEITATKEGMFSTSAVTLRVDHDGSVLVEEEGPLTVNTYVIQPGPGIPTVEAFEAARVYADAAGVGPEQAAGEGAANREKALALLGLSDGVTDEEILTAYRIKASQYHPDRFADAPPEFRDLAHQKMVELNEVRESLNLAK